MQFIFLDTETTGLDPSKHRAIEIAYKIVRNSKVIVSNESIIMQPREVLALADPKSLKINGFTEELILLGKSEPALAAEITQDFKSAKVGLLPSVFVCQNPSFDRAFFNQLISATEQQALRWPYHWLDLASMFFAKFPDIEEEKQLTKNAIARALGLAEEATPHRAMNGVLHLMSCFEALFAREYTKREKTG